jgi:hypothetical protein
MAATPLEIYKAQGQVLVPLVRELIAQIGETKTHAIVRKALGEHFRNFGKEVFASLPGPTFARKLDTVMEVFGQDALEWKKGPQANDDTVEYTVTSCKYAEFYKQLGAPELGFMFACSQDYPLTEGMDERAVMERPTTIMRGDGQCNFKFYLARDKEEAQRKRTEEEARNNVWGSEGRTP